MNITKVSVGDPNGEIQEYYIQDTISGYTSFEINRIQPGSAEVGKITFNGSTYTLYAPNAEVENTLGIYINNNGTNLVFDDTPNTQSITIFDNNVIFERLSAQQTKDLSDTFEVSLPLIPNKTYTILYDYNVLGNFTAVQDGDSVKLNSTTTIENNGLLTCYYESEYLSFSISPSQQNAGSSYTRHIIITQID